jgi:hypothetical protein
VKSSAVRVRPGRQTTGRSGDWRSPYSSAWSLNPLGRDEQLSPMNAPLAQASMARGQGFSAGSPRRWRARLVGLPSSPTAPPRPQSWRGAIRGDRKALRRLAAPVSLQHRDIGGLDATTETSGVEQGMGPSMHDELCLQGAESPAAIARSDVAPAARSSFTLSATSAARSLRAPGRPRSRRGGCPLSERSGDARLARRCE